MADWCVENNISLIGFGTAASGILSDGYLNKGAPTPEEQNTASIRMHTNTAARFDPWCLAQELLQTMNAVAAEVRSSGGCPQCNASNMAQRYVLDTPGVASIIIGMRNQVRRTPGIDG
jgi:aryl-alcohol dehydrogenase-like predicted oxidoreductase